MLRSSLVRRRVGAVLAAPLALATPAPRQAARGARLGDDCICDGPGTTLHVYSLLTRYLTNLPAGPR